MLEVRGAHTEELDAAARCIAAAFTDNPGELPDLMYAFQRSLTTDTHFAPENTRVAVSGGRVVGVLHIADRRMLIDGAPVRVGFIPWLGVLSDHRRHGYASLLLQDAVSYMEREGYDLSLVPGEGLEAFYERAGWCNFQHFYYARLELPPQVPAPRFAGVIRSIDWARDLDAIMAIHDQYNQDTTGLIVRTRDFWSEYGMYWLSDSEFDYPMFYVAECDGEIVAYLRNGFYRAILEVGFRRDAGDAALALVFHACREARLAGAREVYAVALEPFRAQLEAAGLRLNREKSSGYLYRIIRLPSLMEKLLPRMQMRWKAAPVRDWAGSIRVESPVGDTYLRAQNGRLSIALYTATPTIRLRLTHPQAIDLIFGQADLSHLLIETAITWPTTLAVLETLFPNREYRYYPKDAF